MPPAARDEQFEIRSLRPPIKLPVALVWRRARSIAPAARTFIEFVRAEMAVSP